MEIILCCLLQSQSLLDQVSLKRILVYVSTDSEDLSTASAHLLQNIITWISDVENIRKAKDKYETRRLAESGCKDRPWVWVADKIGQSNFFFIYNFYPGSGSGYACSSPTASILHVVLVQISIVKKVMPS